MIDIARQDSFLPLSDIQATDGAGIEGFISGISQLARQFYIGRLDALGFVHALGDRYAYIRLRDLRHPLRFLRQMAGQPPVRLGSRGFRVDLLDDENPARHYVALLFVGYYAPRWLATLVLFAWEFAGFVRYGGQWSWPDIRSGFLGVQHGALVRRYGPTVLPSLVAAQVAERDTEI